MHDLYSFVSGPLVWVTFIIFLGGCAYRLWRMLTLVSEKEKFIHSYMSFKYGLRSILRWSIPFSTVNMQRHPWMTIVTLAFHICLVVTPIFLMAHVLMWEEAWSIAWWTLPDAVADVMTLIVIGGCLFFLLRRLILPEVKFVTSASDFVLLAIVAAPFVPGVMDYHQWGNYPVMMILHILCGHVMLVAIQFTRLSHMLFAPFTRAYIGSEFGAIRHARDW